MEPTIVIEYGANGKLASRAIPRRVIENAPTIGHAKALLYAEVCLAIAQVEGHAK